MSSRRNYVLFFTDRVLFVNAMTFLSINTVIPFFLETLGANTLHIGIAYALVSIGAFLSQPVFSKLAMELVYKRKTFIRILMLQRLLFLAVVLLIPVFSTSKPGFTVILFLVFWGIFCFFTGSYSPFYMSLFSRIIPENHRGRLLGFGGAAANIIALGAAFVLGFLLKALNFPYNYMCIFGIGTVLLIIDAINISLIQEPPDIIVERKTGYYQYVKEIPFILKGNRNFQKLILGNIFFVITNISLAYYTLYAVRGYGAGEAQISQFTAITVIISTLGNMAFGIISDRYSHRVTLILSAICGFAAGLTVLGLNSMIAVFAAFALSNLCSCGYMISTGIIIIENSPKEEIPLYISINGMITLVVSALATVISSIVIDVLSFKPVFFMAGLAGLGAFMVFYLFNKPDTALESREILKGNE